ncbi:hypothetical protein [Streptomyces sp. NPDC088925]|uniref:hypothetical protein n=1 Tax=Streptomyces sp. NPDC088925 TaxID=3365914 RepID=UPI00380236E6
MPQSPRNTEAHRAPPRRRPRLASEKYLRQAPAGRARDTGTAAAGADGVFAAPGAPPAERPDLALRLVRAFFVTTDPAVLSGLLGLPPEPGPGDPLPG